MANTWFQFQQFTIHQDQCGMKVSTDACLLGACATRLLTAFPHFKKGLDIGTGTGLLPLMIVQEHSQLQFDAYEIEKAAYIQARQNVAASPWPTRISLYHQNVISAFTEKDNTTTYDFIISNPPFFVNQLEANAQHRNLARHTMELRPQVLLPLIASRLKEGGVSMLLYPASMAPILTPLIAKVGLTLIREIKIYPNTQKNFNRVIFVFGKNTHINNIDLAEDIYIRDNNTYTPVYESLLSKFLLKKI